jgi:hypothetical protein
MNPKIDVNDLLDAYEDIQRAFDEQTRFEFVHYVKTYYGISGYRVRKEIKNELQSGVMYLTGDSMAQRLINYVEFQ